MEGWAQYFIDLKGPVRWLATFRLYPTLQWHSGLKTQMPPTGD